jgi:hypothetical protein
MPGSGNQLYHVFAHYVIVLACCQSTLHLCLHCPAWHIVFWLLLTYLEDCKLCPFCLQFPLCISLLEEGKIRTEPLITHRLAFSEAEVLKGFQIASNSATTGAIKVMFSW